MFLTPIQRSELIQYSFTQPDHHCHHGTECHQPHLQRRNTQQRLCLTNRLRTLHWKLRHLGQRSHDQICRHPERIPTYVSARNLRLVRYVDLAELQLLNLILLQFRYSDRRAGLH